MATGLDIRIKRLEAAEEGMVTDRARRGAAHAVRLGIIPQCEEEELARELSQPGFWPGVVTELQRRATA